MFSKGEGEGRAYPAKGLIENLQFLWEQICYYDVFKKYAFRLVPAEPTCYHHLLKGNRINGLYQVNSFVYNKTMAVICDMAEKDGSGNIQ